MNDPVTQSMNNERRGPIARVTRVVARLGLAGVVLLTAGVVCLLATFYAISFGWSQLAPGGTFSELKAGEAVPPIVLSTVDGATVDVDDLRGSVVALNFWTTWCPPCVAEVPRFNKAMVEHAEVPLSILGVNVNEPNDDVVRFVQDNDVRFTVVLDGDGGFFKRFRVKTLPTTVWIDRDGIVRAIHEGGLSSAQIDQYVRRLDGAAQDDARDDAQGEGDARDDA
jgi:thiol-disulfide isomerase/thioredoxin